MTSRLRRRREQRCHVVPSGSATITTAAAVDAAGGVEFKNPSTGDPAYVVQTGDGTYAAFTAICTHDGCTVAYVKKASQFQCPCHGGVYDARTGKVLGGPPPAPLPVHLGQERRWRDPARHLTPSLRSYPDSWF